MMITRPSQYSVGNPASAGATTTTARNNSRPVSSLYHNASKFNLEPGTFNANKRSSYHEDDEAENRSPGYSHMKDISGSIESLDEGGLTLDTTELDNDPDLVLKAEEPEAWSVTVDKKIVKKMSKKDVKRQENIFEFIQTERNYLTTLKMMKLIFARGMQREVGCEWSVIDKMFPLIDEHVDFVANFVNKLRERQALNKVVDRIGDIMTSQWSEDGGDRMKRLFGAFCSRHNEMTAMYKEMLKNDKKFAAFVKKCEKNPLTRRQGIRECALLVTQRITKYPIMLQTLLDNTVQKDHEADHADVDRALELCRAVAKDVDEQVRAHERRMQLVDIHERTDARSSTTMKGRRFDRKDFLRRNRKLLFSSNNVQWRVKDTKRPVETMFILLSDCIVLLQDNNGKYAFSSGQPASVPLHQLIVREVANNDKGLYLLNPNTQQMYELYVSSVDECKNMMQVIRYAVGNCPDEDEGMASEDDEERLRHERSLDRARKTIEQLQEKDRHINRLLEEKMGLFKTLAESVDRGSAVENVAVNYPIFSVTMPGAGGDMTDDSASSGGKTLPPATPTLVKAIEQVTKLTHAFYGPGGLTRHPSSAGEHESGSRTTPALPKRSDTFGGFDNGKVPALPRDKYLSASSSSSSQHTDVDTQAASDASKRDSGLVDGDVIISPPHDSHKSARETSPSPTSSHETTDMTSYPQVVPTSDQVAAFSNLTNLLNSYLSIAAQQDTYVEKLQQQLNQLQDQPKTSTNKKRPGGNLEEAELKRNQIKQQEQMDDLRKQQQQLKTEREQWQRHQDRYKKSMDREQSELEADKRRVAAEKEEAGRERDEVHRAKDEVQKELTRLRALQKKFENAAVPPIHTSVSLSSLASSSAGAASNKNNNNQAVDPLRSSERTLSARKPQSGSSAGDAAGKKPLPSPTYSSAAEYPRTFPGSKRDSAAPGNAGAASSGASGHHQVPLHLQFSATNQLTTGQRPTQQEIPMQLSKLASLSSNKQHAAPKNMSNKLVAKLATSTSVTHSSSSSTVVARAAPGDHRQAPASRHHHRKQRSESHLVTLTVDHISPDHPPHGGGSQQRSSSARESSAEDGIGRPDFRLTGDDHHHRNKRKTSYKNELFL